MQIEGIKIAQEIFAKQYRTITEGKKNSASWVIYGIKNNLKFHLALAVAFNLLTKAGVPEQALKTKIEDNCHPDLMTINTDSSIKVDDIRNAIQFSQSTAIEANTKVLIINNAETMTNSATNALLKLLEEPKKGLTIILVCHNLGNLLPTIRSRVFKLPLPRNFNSDILAQKYNNADENITHLIAQYVGIVKNEEEFETFSNFFIALENYLSTFKADALTSFLTGNSNVIRYFIDYILNFIYKKSMHQTTISNLDMVEDVKSLLNDALLYHLDPKHYLNILSNKLQHL